MLLTAALMLASCGAIISPHPQAAAPGEMGRGLTHKLTICPRSVGEGRTPVPVTALTAQTVQCMPLFLRVLAQGNIKFHFYTGPTYRAYTMAELGCLGQSSLTGMASHFRLLQDCQIWAFKNQDSGLKGHKAVLKLIKKKNPF